MGTLFNVLLYEGILLILIFGDVQLWGFSSEPFPVQTFDCIAVRLFAQPQSVGLFRVSLLLFCRIYSHSVFRFDCWVKYPVHNQTMRISFSLWHKPNHILSGIVGSP